MALTPKQERFVAEYLIDLNSTQAAIRSGLDLQKCANDLAGFYVYLLCCPEGRIFYVGKGTGRRYITHIRNARAGRIDNAAKHQAIREVIDAGGEVTAYCLDHGLQESVAYALEREIIRAIGRDRLTNAVAGCGSSLERHVLWAKERLAEIQPEEAYLEWIATFEPWRRKAADLYLRGLKFLVESPEDFMAWKRIP